MSLPVIRGTSAALYPYTMTISFATEVVQMQNGKQQRWVKRPVLVRFEVPYAALTQAQKNTVLAAVTSAKGQFDTTLSLTVGATTYTNLSLDSDDFTARESKTTQYEAPLKLSQVVGQNLSPGTAGQTFPALANGALCVLPYTQGKRFQTVATMTPGGTKQTYTEWGASLTGYPSNGLKFWELEESKLSDVDIATRIAHFIANWGRCFIFPVIDEPSGFWISASINNLTTSIPFASDPGMAVGQVFQLESEWLIVTSAYAGGNVTATRGYNSTAAASHALGAGNSFVFTKCHYAMDEMAIRYTGVNDSSVTIKIEETNN
jgi:hypothetical protein